MFNYNLFSTFINILKSKEGIIVSIFINIFLYIFGGILANISNFFATLLNLLQISALFCFFFSLFYFIKRKMR